MWLWVRDAHSGPLGRVDGSPLVVVPGGALTQIAILPERSGGEEPGGDAPGQWGREFVVVNKGRGQLPTKGTAKRIVETWMQANR